MQIDYIASGESNGLFVKLYRGEDMVLLASILTYLYAHRISSALASSILLATRPHDVYNFLTFECVRLAAKATKLISGIGRPCVRQFSSSAGHTYLACRLMVRSRTASPLCLGTETNRLWPGRRPRRVSGPTVRRVASSSMLDLPVVRKGGSRREHLSLLLLSALRRQPFDEAAGRRGQWGGEVGVLRPLLFVRGNRARRYPA